MTSASREIVVQEECAGLRLDRFLAGQFPEHSRTRIQESIREGIVRHNGRIVRPSEQVKTGDVILWADPAPITCESAKPEDIPLDIIFEDAHLIIINKPAGMVVHPGAGNQEGTLVSALLHHATTLSSLGGFERPGIVHRLDKETSGCLVVAKTDTAHRILSRAFASREVQKTYLAVVKGVPRRPKGIIEAPIGRHPVHRKKMTVSEPGHGREAVTEYRVLKSLGNRTLVECLPKTGRTHQIRVHLKHIGSPISGDPLYGHRDGLSRHLLHAWKLEFNHPISGIRQKFEALPPPEFLFP